MMFGKLILSLFVALTFALPSTSQAGDDDLQYFKQFMYKVIPTGDDPDFPTYRYEVLGTDVFHEIPTSPTQYLTTTTMLYLFEDGTYKGNYRENIHTRGEDGFWPRGCKSFSGTWSVPDKELVIEKDGKVLATGTRHIEHGQYAVMFTFQESILAPELKGQTIPGGMFQSNYPVEQERCW